LGDVAAVELCEIESDCDRPSGLDPVEALPRDWKMDVDGSAVSRALWLDE
jgi:hypothetical protein